MADAELWDEDTRLMVRARAGDRRSFEMLFARHSRPLVSYLRRFVGAQALAEELAQEVFLKIYRARESYEPRAKFKTFLYRVATNHCLNELRRGVHRAAHDALGAASEAGGPALELHDPGPGPEALAEARDVAAAVDAALRELPETQRAALLLLRYQGLSYDEIGEALSLSVPAVKSLLNRAKTSLRTRLAAHLGDDREDV